MATRQDAQAQTASVLADNKPAAKTFAGTQNPGVRRGLLPDPAIATVLSNAREEIRQGRSLDLAAFLKTLP